MKDTVSICLSVYNQEKIIEQILFGILSNASINVKEFIVLLDGCTDQSEQIVRKVISNIHQIDCKILESDDVWETKANNITFKNATCDYIASVQDDMVIKEKDFDQRLLKPFKIIDNLLGVTARNAQNETLDNNWIKCYNVAGKDVNTPKNIFAIRDVIVRGPILFDRNILQSLGYLDEEFAPIYGDDKDLCFRAYRKGFLVGFYGIDYDSFEMWGKTRTNPEDKKRYWAWSANKNEKMLIERHRDLLLGNKHDQDIIIE